MVYSVNNVPLMVSWTLFSLYFCAEDEDVFGECDCAGQSCPKRAADVAIVLDVTYSMQRYFGWVEQLVETIETWLIRRGMGKGTEWCEEKKLVATITNFSFINRQDAANKEMCSQPSPLSHWCVCGGGGGGARMQCVLQCVKGWRSVCVGGGGGKWENRVDSREVLQYVKKYSTGSRTGQVKNKESYNSLVKNQYNTIRETQRNLVGPGTLFAFP